MLLSVPRIAVGLSVRDPHLEELLQLDRSAIDVVEVMIDEALDPGCKRNNWRKIGARWPLLAHGTYGPPAARAWRGDYCK